ncbi:hypothetical protein FRB96_005057 [Tulasnella sp. 330]|nr:hypothetical protein FRB96_005057 [Tulasnella sp. 330]
MATSPVGLSLPKVHLGSFSALDIVGNMYDDDGSTAARAGAGVGVAISTASPELRNENTAPEANGDNIPYGGGGTPIDPVLMQDTSMSSLSDGREWTQQPPAAATPSRPDPRATSPAASHNQPQPTRQISGLSSPSSFLPSGSISQQVDTPPTDMGSPSLPSPTTTPKSLSYLPPGAASPHYTTPTRNYPFDNGMAGIGSGGGRATSSVYSRTGRPPSSPPPPQEQSPRDRGTVRSQSSLAEPSQQPNGVVDGSRDRVDGTAPGPSRRQPSQRQSSSPSPPNPTSSPDLGRMNQESYAPNGMGMGMHDPSYGAAASPSRRKTSQYYPQTMQALPVNQASPYPSMPSSASPQQQQQSYINDPQPQLQTRGGPKVASVVVEEVCIECMMRDRDMADIDVLGEGVWERESDASYNELVRLEDEAEHRAGMSGMSLGSFDYHQSTGRPKARGWPLSTENLKVWLTMNPKEPQARWQTLEAYLKSQSALLMAEAAARAQAVRESRLLDNRMRETYSQIRESSQDLSIRQSQTYPNGLPPVGVPIRVPRSASVYSNAPVGSAERDATLLESGLIVERVDLKKEEQEERARMKREELSDRQLRLRMSATGTNDAASAYSAPSPTIDNTVLYQGASPYAMANQSVGQLSPSSNNRFSVMSSGQGSSIRPGMNRPPSHMSTDTTTTGSMMDMHLGLDQDRRAHVGQALPYDFSAPPSMVHGAGDAQYIDRGFVTEPEVANDRASSAKTKKKSKGLGKLWKLMTGQGKDPVEQPKTKAQRYVEEDLSQPLAPPPPISYLVNGRSDHGPHSKHRTSPSLSTGLTSPHSRENGSDDPRSSRDDGAFDVDGGDERDDSYRSRNNRRPSISDLRMQQARALAPSPTPTYPEKSLPPLPYDNSMAPKQPVRPATLYANRNESYSQGDLLAPHAPFKSETRRQSFNGVPNGVQNSAQRQSWAVPNQNGGTSPPPIPARYDEFGGSRRSLVGPVELARRPDDEDATLSSRRSKTRSRFGISALFAPTKKTSPALPPMLHLGASSSATLAPARPYDVNHGRDYSISHSSFSDVGNPRSNGSHNARASLNSTKKLALIPQEEDFVAYRYPSHSQTLPNYR